MSIARRTQLAAASRPHCAAQDCTSKVALTDMAPGAKQARNPRQGLTLEAMLVAHEAHHGWADLAQRIPIPGFTLAPSFGAILKFLRKTPWAREMVESLDLFT